MIKKKRILILKYKILQKLKLIYLFNFKFFFVIGLFFFNPYKNKAQQIFYQDVFYGGVTAGGFSTGQGSGSGSFSLYIEPSSTIRKAFLFTYRIGYAPNVPIIINGSPYLFDTTNVLMQVNHKSSFASPVHLYYYDFTDSLNANITSNFNVTIPTQSGLPLNWGYWTTFIYIAYENPTLPSVATSIWINDEDFLGNQFYNYQNLIPIDNTHPVALSLYSDRTSDTLFTEGYNTYVNANLLGAIGGFDSSTNGGVKGHFYYQNNALFGLDDDTPDSLMGGSDGLADIRSYINNNDTSFDLRLVHQKYPNNLATRTNINLAEILAYSSPCDTFSTNITPNDTICLGDSLQLNASGGNLYSWYGTFGGLNDTSIANPKASPPQTSTYIVTITNDSGCVKTEQVKIWVNPLPEPDTIIITNNVCGDSSGVINVGNIPNGTAPFTYSLTNLITLNTQNSTLNTFTNLGTGTYEILITDSNGCQWLDTATVNEVNNVNANFTATPQTGVAPLDVTFSNISAGANNYEWTIINNQLNDTIIQNSSFNIQHLFDSAGTYQVCLVAFNNLPRCADTICKTIVVEDEISLIIPNVFTPNGDNENDNFVIQLTGAALIKNLKAEVFNRWGMLVNSVEFSVMSDKHTQHSTPHTQYTLWDGSTTAAALAPEGTYFYVITYQTLKGEVESKKGSLTLLR